ncbi:iron complex outermembrane recepter protein [Duganella sp. CF517]|uniref:TonB-dependent receptor n=1 Tax=Duganella sp. CF517 TaxID=1881038 RepID=UPI0008C79078|nr:TonB-dependent receptor [Duganella sp. CF517]SEN87411.1 iron complex outermembrane recepter protein [Duganella sp. CF517]
MKTTTRPLAAAISLALTNCPYAHADDTTANAAMQTVTINSSRSALDPDLPTTSVTKTQDELRQQQNIFNPEDALRNMPSMTIRKRYSGDRNALVGGRSFSTTQAPRALVTMDGYLLSNFLGRFDAPRWNMIAPEEMTRVDVLYGPFSALYPGNSIGTTIAVTTSRPAKFEGSVRVAVQDQSFDQYGLKDHYRNYQGSALIGDRLASGLWYKLMVNHQDSTSQPMGYYTATANVAGAFATPAGAGAATPVTGIRYDTGPFGTARAIFGANAGAIDHTRQDTVKTTLGYDFNRTVSAEGFVAWWSNESVTRNQSFMRDAAGNTVWSGRVTDGANVFVVPTAAFAPYTRDERHAQAGATVKTRNGNGWNGSVSASAYRIMKDVQRNAGSADPFAAGGGAGNAVLRDGSGFNSVDLQTTYSPVAGDWTGGAHALTIGLHADDYKLEQSTRATADWRNAAGPETQFIGGETRIVALYGQDAWRFAPQWTATLGVRAESWQARNGAQRIPGAAQNYPGRSEQAWSPKLSLGWDAAADTTLRLSAGRGARFATVAELFQGTAVGSAIVVNDPNLKPERSNALELMAEQRHSFGMLRASLFQDDVRDAIWSQLNLSVFPNVTNVTNVGRVRTRGLELVAQVDRLGVAGLSADANIAFSKSTILENATYQPSVGKDWTRVPRVRGATTLTYAPGAKWSASATYRYSGRQFNEMNNSDYNTDVYGAISRVSQVDMRLLFKPVAGTELAVGIDNLNDDRAYQMHPYPGRTLFAEMRYAF